MTALEIVLLVIAVLVVLTALLARRDESSAVRHRDPVRRRGEERDLL
jgi:hypothetical protein